MLLFYIYNVHQLDYFIMEFLRHFQSISMVIFVSLATLQVNSIPDFYTIVVTSIRSNFFGGVIGGGMQKRPLNARSSF